MSEEQVGAIANGADMIVNGYAFTVDGSIIRILNLSAPARAAVFLLNGDVNETSMDDIELGIVSDYLNRNREFLGV